MAHPGTLHRYNHPLVAFEHSPPQSSTTSPSTSPTHTLLWLGGLSDGLLTVQYPAAIARSLPPSWRLAEVLISSSYEGWATGSLKRDAQELAACVKYFQSLRGKAGGKIVAMGHSTGCQDIMELCVGTGKGEVALDGAILQGGVSDREAFADMAAKQGLKAEFDAVVQKARELVDEGRGGEIMRKAGNAMGDMLDSPMTAYRTLSLLSKGGDDDYFSSDLEDAALQASFGAFPKETPLAFLLGELDPYVPAEVGKEELLGRWTRFVRSGGGVVDDVHGGVVKGAHHNLDGDPEEVVQELVRRVLGFLEGVESGNVPGVSRL
ncbi:DUF1749-domain-containing protein [Melanomma pulvis-pyrius CBS 109.77]|uniref:DUF1749-domain-containing protein n=1 Tax=Melanomma pulvis-pyrius CBS 109.77 TaxID=1314802 RepID=A0A6A6XRZ6_9PLEO|nr:DUF1749-domain-containing protein [Melanomma pulvis-pyrius CBS 109.77]